MNLPVEGDYVISTSTKCYNVSIHGGSRNIGSGKTWNNVVDLILDHSKQGFYPNVWLFTEKGNYIQLYWDWVEELE